MYLFHYHLRRAQCDIDVHDGLYHTPSRATVLPELEYRVDLKFH